MDRDIYTILLIAGLVVTFCAIGLRAARSYLSNSSVPWHLTREASEMKLDEHPFVQMHAHRPERLTRRVTGFLLLGYGMVVLGLFGLASTVAGLSGWGLALLTLGVALSLELILQQVIGGRSLRRALKVGALLTPLVARGWRTATENSSGEPAGVSPVNQEFLEYAIRVSVEADFLDKERETLLSGIMAYGETVARAVMIPRTDMVVLSIESSLEDVLAIIEEEGFSRFPVVEDSADEVAGILVVKDLLPYLRGPRKEPFQLRNFVRQPYFVPETKRISELMREMQGRKLHLALVADEFGGIAGLVTQEDIIEEVFGEIYDESDAEETPEIQELEPGRFLVDARVSVKDFEDAFTVEVPDVSEAEFDTLAGFVVAQVGRVLTQGETFAWKHLQMVVREADTTHIRSLEVHVGAPPEDHEAGSGSGPGFASSL